MSGSEAIGPARVIGIVGAGTMGTGIAQLACTSGAQTLLHDPIEAALARGEAAVASGLDRAAQRGKLSITDAAAAAARLHAAPALQALAGCDLVIEAAPESLSVKHELYARLCGIVGPSCVLATNTSSLPVTAIAAAATHPERVVGMHFFNPPAAMRLVEVVAGAVSDDRSLAVARATGLAMGKRVILAADGPGFLVNRCGRPFGLEALRMLSERIATVEQIDRICRLGAGFRMGPFELMDLVGVDVGFDVSRSFYEQSFGEPRWRPSPITARLVAAGLTGRKSGHGYYDYTAGPHRPDDPPAPDPPPAAAGEDLIVVAGERPVAHELRAAAHAAGWAVEAYVDPDGPPPWLILDCGSLEDDPPLQGGPQAVLCADGSLAALDPEGSAVGFHLLPPVDDVGLVELTRSATTTDVAADRACAFFGSLGKHCEWVSDAPGLVLGRIVCQLVNEAAFALGEGIGSAEDIDAGMLLGLNHPHGPLTWADTIGLDHVLSVLDGLADEYREDRYRAAPLLRRLVWEGRLGRGVGTGFFEHEAT